MQKSTRIAEIIIIIILTMTMFMVLSSRHSHCESSPGSFDECRLSAGWPPTLRPKQPIWAVGLKYLQMSQGHVLCSSGIKLEIWSRLNLRTNDWDLQLHFVGVQYGCRSPSLNGYDVTSLPWVVRFWRNLVDRGRMTRRWREWSQNRKRK